MMKRKKIIPNLSLFFLLITITSCTKESNQQSKIAGKWTSEKRVVWLTITPTSSTGIPMRYFYLPPKDTFDFSDEQLEFHNDGKLYIAVGDARINPNSTLAMFNLPNDTINYTHIDNHLTLDKRGRTIVFDIQLLSNNQMSLHTKTSTSSFTREDWTFYNK